MATTTAEELADLMVAALLREDSLGPTGQTIAEQRVYSARDWPSADTAAPEILFEMADEEKASISIAAPEFDVTAIIRLHGRVTAPAEIGDAGANAIRDVLTTFRRQIEVAIINDFDLMLKVAFIQSVRSRLKTIAQGKQHLGEVAIEFRCTFRQGPEDFAPPTFSPLDEITLYADLINHADPTGTYTPGFPYPVTSPPRTQGPEGRAEGRLLIDLS